MQGVGVKVKASPQLISDSTMPNIVGMKLQDALWICEKKGLQVKCEGKGKVVSQSIAQGQVIIKGQQIQIQFSQSVHGNVSSNVANGRGGKNLLLPP